MTVRLPLTLFVSSYELEKACVDEHMRSAAAASSWCTVSWAKEVLGQLMKSLHAVANKCLKSCIVARPWDQNLTAALIEKQMQCISC